MGLFIACSSPPVDTLVEQVSNEPAVAEQADEAESAEAEVEEADVAEPAEEMVEEESEEEMEADAEEMADEETDETEMSMSESESVVTAVDGPTHTPAATIEEAIVERAYDQAKGADQPLMTIIEYGDFQ